MIMSAPRRTILQADFLAKVKSEMPWGESMERFKQGLSESTIPVACDPLALKKLSSEFVPGDTFSPVCSIGVPWGL